MLLHLIIDIVQFKSSKKEGTMGGIRHFQLLKGQ